MKYILSIFKESLRFAFRALRENKLRTFLSLLGITIGIFSIISVFTVVDSLKNNIQTSINDLGSDVIFIQKWPWTFGSDYPWWKYFQRPEASYADYKYVKKYTPGAAQVCMQYSMGDMSAKYRSNDVDNVSLVGVSASYPDIQSLKLANGRFFSNYEESSAMPVCVVGYDIANKLYGTALALDKAIKVDGHKFRIIGVTKKQGSSIMGNGTDDMVLIPESYIRHNYNLYSQTINKLIMVSAKKNVTIEALKSQLEGTMRAVRRLKPKADDNFALNQTSLLTQGFEKLFAVINIAGLVIGLFSVIVGGFSIANIMFVSVKERTKHIGIKKSLGAKSYFVLLEFLFESVILCLIGGIAGLLLVFIGTLIADGAASMGIMLTFGNIMLGVFISVIIGIVSGILPAYSASRMNPVDAIRS